MAEIKIQKKKGMPVWAMLLALILLALLVWAYLRARGDDQPEAPRNVAVLAWNPLVDFSFPEALCA